MSPLFPSKPEELFENLPFPERFVLWSIRLWVDGLQSGCSISEKLQDAYRLARVDDAYLDLDAIMTIVAISSSGPIDIRCEQCASISDDEQIFLHWLAISQAGFPNLTDDVLFQGWMPVAAVNATKPHLSQFTLKLQKAGLLLMFGSETDVSGYSRRQLAAPDPVTA